LHSFGSGAYPASSSLGVPRVIPQDRVILNDNLQRECHKSNGPPTCHVTASTMNRWPESTSAHQIAAATSGRRHSKSGVTQWHATRILITDVSPTKGSTKILAPPPLWLQNTLTYAHTTSRTVPTCDISLGSPTVAMPEAGEFVE
jgi:hypothetical protein